MAERKRVGFVGLGAMGGPMATNLLKAGFPVKVYDLVPERIQALVGRGASAAASAADAAAGADVTITMVPASADSEAAILGPKGVAEGARRGSIVIDMSTIAPSVSRRIAARLAERGLRMLDAPVARQVAAAVAGTLAIFVGGDRATLDEAADVLAAMGTDIYHCGPHGAGAVVKVINNMLAAMNVAALCEAMVLGVKAGVRPEVLVEAVGGGSGGSFALQNHVRKFILAGKFEEGVFPVDYIMKDLGLALEVAHELAVPLPHTALAMQQYEACRAAGYARRYYPVLVTLFERLAGVEVRGDANAPSVRLDLPRPRAAQG